MYIVSKSTLICTLTYVSSPTSGAVNTLILFPCKMVRSPKGSPGYHAKLHMVARLQFRSLESVKYFIIIMSCSQHGYPWPSLATPPYSSSLLVGLQGYIPHPHRAALCMFELVVLLLFGHMRGSIGVLNFHYFLGNLDWEWQSLLQSYLWVE